MIRYRFITHNGERLYDVGIDYADGTLHNPNGYPDALVRAAITAVDGRRRERRVRGAKLAADTRRRRRERLVYDVAQRLIAGGNYGPAQFCVICRKLLSDVDSVRRGIGSDCWQQVLALLEQQQRRLPAALPISD